MMRKAMFCAIVALGFMATGADARAADYGMPPDVARTARAECAKTFKSLSLQDVCMQNEGAAYNKLNGPSYTSEAVFSREEEERKTRVRAESGYRDPGARVLACGAGYRMTDRDGCQPR